MTRTNLLAIGKTLVLGVVLAGCAQGQVVDEGEDGLGGVVIARPRPIPEILETKVEIWNGVGGGDFERYGTEAFVDKGTSSARAWHFRFHNNLPGTSKLLYQVTLFDPKAAKKNWDTPPGLVAEAPASSLWVDRFGLTHFDIDFSKLPVVTRGTLPLPLPVGPNGVATNLPNQPGGGIVHIPPTRFSKLPARDPIELFVRLIPVDALGVATGAPSRAVRAIFGTTPRPEISFKSLHPTVQFVSFTPAHAEQYESDRHFIVTEDNRVLDPTHPFTFLKAGAAYSPPVHSSSWFDDLCDGLSQFASFIKDAWNWVVHKYEEIKSTFIDLVASSLCPSGLPACRELITAAVDAGLAACGLPPNLPDFDEVMGDFKDYAIKEMAEESGLPEEAVRRGVDAMADAAAELRSNGGVPGAFLRPDPAWQYASARLVVRVTNPRSDRALDAGQLIFGEGAETPDSDRMIGALRWKGKSAWYPSLAPGASYDVPIALEPMIDPIGWRITEQESIAKAAGLLGFNTTGWSHRGDYSATGFGAYVDAVNKAIATAKLQQKQWEDFYTQGWALFHLSTRFGDSGGFGSGTLFGRQAAVNLSRLNTFGP